MIYFLELILIWVWNISEIYVFIMKSKIFEVWLQKNFQLTFNIISLYMELTMSKQVS